jgi:hypothetical protein
VNVFIEELEINNETIGVMLEYILKHIIKKEENVLDLFENLTFN